MVCYSCNKSNNCSVLKNLRSLSNDFAINKCKEYAALKDRYKKMAEHDKLMRLIYDYFTAQIEYGNGVDDISKEDIERYITSVILDL